MKPRSLLTRWFFRALLLCLLGGPAFATTQELLTNGGFEPPYSAVSGTNTGGTVSGNFPSGWLDNSRSQGKQTNNTYSEETTGTVSGSAFKSVLATDPGANPVAIVQIYQKMNFTAGRTLTASVWLKASVASTVSASFILDVSPFTTRKSQNFSVTTSWQQFTVTFTPTITEPGRLMLTCNNQPITLWMDEASITVDSGGAPVVVSPSGSDTTGSGTLAAPYQTIAKAMASVYPGDTVQIRAGTYRETITPTQSGNASAPITITNYNSEVVTVTGADTITGPWTAGSNGIYTAGVNVDLTEGLNQVFVDGAMVNEAREPNYGSGDLLHPATATMTVTATATQSADLAKVDSAITTTLTSKPDNFYAGARLHAGIQRKWAWQGGTIDSSTGNTLTLGVASETGSWWFLGSGTGYLFGLLSLLDSDNEWFLQHNASAPHTLSLRITGQVDPTGHLVEIRNRTYTLEFNSKNYIVVRGLNLRCGDIHMTGTGDVLDHCDISYLSHFLAFTSSGATTGGILEYGTNDTVSYCTIHDTAGCAVQVRGTGNLVTRNHIYNTDYSATYSDGIAISSPAQLSTVTFNTVHHSGRDGILLIGGSSGGLELTQPGHFIAYNEVYEPGQMCRDLGCIYTFSSNAQGVTGGATRIAYNWCHDNHSGNPTGTTLSILMYFDNWDRNYIFDHNVCWNGTGDSGIRMNGPNDGHKLYHNTLYNCDDANTHTFTTPLPNAGNPELTFFFTGATYAAPDLRNNLYLSTTPDVQLTNSAIRDFRPKAGAAAIDSATLIAGYNDNYVGMAPDKGAYEVGGAYWVPGVNGWAIDQPGSVSSAATSVTGTTATANGTLISAGTAATTVSLYWGTSDGGTVPAAWANVTTLGTAFTGTYQALSPQLTGLTPATMYWYRYRSTNVNGDTWSDPQSLTTLDTIPPTISGTFSPLTIATGGSATVALPNYTGQAVTSDNVGVTSVTQSPVAGTAQSVGTTHVTLTAQDAAGNTASTAFDVVVTDGTLPVLTLPANMTVEATSAAGAVVGFTATATDNVGTPSVVATPASGSTFALGTTTVNVTASDAAGNMASGSFTVTVRDTTAPVVATTFPTTGTTFTTVISAFQIRGTASDAVGVTQVTWTNDRGGSGTATGTTSWDSGINAIPLQLGANVLTIRAFDAASNFGTKTLTVTRNTATPTTYYVATNGSDTNNGTSLATPFATVSKGITKAGELPGNTLYIRGGTYREIPTGTVPQVNGVNINGNGLIGGEPGNYVNILAYPGETPILKGSQAVTGWTLNSGSVWKKTGWTINSQQVFVDFDTATDKHPLQQIGQPPNTSATTGSPPEYKYPVGSSLADMAPGRFLWESSSNTLYVQLSDNSDPNTHVIEASTSLRTFQILTSRGYWYIKGLTFCHCNASASKPVGNPPGATVTLDNYCVLDTCNVQWADFAGVGLSNGPGMIVTNCTVANNGSVGIQGGCTGYLVSGNLVTGNNYRGFTPTWHAGGIKLTGNAYGTIERNEVANNSGTGIWFDGVNVRDGNLKTIRNNYIHNNGPTNAADESVGIHFEISKNALIYNNLLVENERQGIYISGSDDAKVFNNTIVRQHGHQAICVDGMPRTGATLTNNLVYNNIVYNDSATNATYDLFIRQNNGNDVAGNASNFNCIYRSTGAIQLNRRSTSVPVAQGVGVDGSVTKTDLASWRTLTGWDTNSINANPTFASGVGTDWTLSTTSPAKDTGTDLAEVATDYSGVIRPQGSATDMGAFEFDPPPTLSPVTIASNNANPAWAKLGDMVTVSFTANESIQTPIVTLLGVTATVANPSGNNWTATATVGAGTAQGTASFSIAFNNLTGTAGTAVSATTNSSAVTVDKTGPVLSLPASFAAEATSAAGRTVTYSASASDALDPAPSFIATPASGTLFALGDTTVNASATDAAGNTTNGSFTVTVQDTTAPTVSGTFSPLALATGAGGTVALPNYTGQAVTSDNVGVTSVTQSPVAGTAQSVGTTHVTLTAQDAAGNTASTAFDVVVTDGTLPVLTLPANMTVEATSAAGAVVSFTATATDNVSTPGVVATPASGSTFPLGTTTVNVTATDAAGNVASGSFTVTVRDTTAPVVAFTFPTSGTTFTTTISAFEIKGTATDAVGVTQVTWTNSAGGSGTATGTTSWDTGINAIPLQLGANVVIFTAPDAAGNSGTKTLTVTRNAATATTYYVATNGNNANNGTSLETPFLTIQKGVNSAGDAPGNILYIRGGTYREDVEVNGNGNRGGVPGNYVNILAYPGETPILKGSQVVTDWVLDSGSVWKKTGWTTNSQQVFVDFDTAADKHPLQQIGRPPNSNGVDAEFPIVAPNLLTSGLADMAPGRFFWDSTSNTLYVQLADNSDPNAHVMEASTTLRTMFFGATRGYWNIKGLTFYHNNASATKPVGNPPGSALVNLDSYSVLDSCNAQWSDFAGISMGPIGTVAKNCTVSNNGDIGIQGNAFDCRIANCLVSGNNYRGWNQLWHAGGIKLTSNSYGTVEQNEVATNNGTGIWFDGCNAGLTIIRGNYVHNNGPKDAGIHFEISSNAQIYNNLLVENQRRGIYISGSDNTKVYNNTIVRQVERAAIEVDGMPRSGHTLTNNLIYNNIVFNNTATNSTYDLFIRQNNGNDVAGNVADYNCVYRSTGAIQLFRRATTGTVAQTTDSGAAKTDLASWRTFTGWDTHSISANPAFVSGVGADWTLSTASPARDTGTNLAEVATDYSGVIRPQGSATDIGAFEFDLPPTLGPVTITSNNANPAWAKVGDTVTVSFTASEAIQTPSVTLLGVAATVANPSGNNWTATATVGAGTAQSTADFSIAFSNLTGNAGTAVSATTDSSAVTVDRAGPVLSLPPSFFAEATSAAGRTVTYAASASDALDPSPSFGVMPVSGTLFALGATTVNATATDAAGNTTNGSFIVTVQDTTPPVIALVGTDPLQVSVGGTLSDPGATALDNVDGSLTAQIVMSVVGGGPVVTTAPGSFTLHYNVSDAAGNPAVTVTRTVNVVDTTPPVITLVGANPLQVSVGGTFMDPGATALDNVDGSLTAQITVSGGPVVTTAPGSFALSYHVSDAAGNAAVVVSRTVNVVDTTPPVITLVGANPLQVSVGGTFTDPGATALDNVDGSLTAQITVTGGPVVTTAPGSFTLNYHVSDAAGNVAAAVSRTVNVVDTTPPVITLVGANPLQVSVGGTFMDPGATALDNVDGSLTAQITVTGGPVVTTAPGSFTLNYHVSDAAGNVAAPVSRTVNVVDTTPPVITLVGANPLQVSVGGTFTDPGATALDNVDASLTSQIIVTGGPVVTTTPGSYTLAYNVSDAAMNAAVAVTRTVNVVDTTPPVLMVPGNQTAEATGATGAVVSFPPASATDNLTLSPTIGYSIASGSVFPLGTTTVNVTATDGAGNVANGSFTVTVVDTTAPVITLTGANPLILWVGETFADPGATAVDLVDGNVTSSIVAGGQAVDSNSPGSYTRTYTASDTRANTSQKQRTVRVVPAVGPVLQFELLNNPTEDARIGFDTIYGLDYELRTSTDLIQWDLLDTFSGDGLAVEMIHTGGGTGPRRFYKVIVIKSGE